MMKENLELVEANIREACAAAGRAWRQKNVCAACIDRKIFVGKMGFDDTFK